MPTTKNMPKKCPACNDTYGCNQKNVMNHIKAKAKSELLKKYLMPDKKIAIPHAEYIKKNFKVGTAPTIIMLGKDTILTVK